MQWACLVGGPVLALIVGTLLPEEYANGKGEAVVFTAAGRATLAMMVWMAVWWLGEAVDIEVTALLPLAAFPLLGIATMKAAAGPFADETIFLFMSGFLLALSMQRWRLDRRIALLTLRLVGTRPANMVAGFMLATAVLSAFVSNTATAAMMLPIAMSVIALLEARQARGDPAGAAAAGGEAGEDAAAPAASESSEGYRNLALCLMLGIAYAASIGGIATVIGTPPNAILVAYIDKNLAATEADKISFARWLTFGGPLVVLFLPIVWLVLTRIIYPIRIRTIPGGRELIEREIAGLGPPNGGQWITFVVFLATACAWIARPWLVKIGWDTQAGRVEPLKGLTDATVGMIGAMLLFIIPVDARRGQFTMNWSTAVKLPWGILILFGGGLSLAAAVTANGVAEFIGSLTTAFQGASPLVLVLAVTTLVIFLTELTSNTATTAALVPVMAALAPGLHVHPYLLIFPTAMAASCAFMLPVATPPNAMVFATGHVTIPQMCKAGLWLNIIGILLITLLTMTLLGPAMGVTLW